MQVTFTRNIGFIFLSIYLIMVGIIAIVPGLNIPTIIFGVLALVAGICILLGI